MGKVLKIIGWILLIWGVILVVTFVLYLFTGGNCITAPQSFPDCVGDNFSASMVDNTGPIELILGVVFIVIGLVLILRNKGSKKRK